MRDEKQILAEAAAVQADARENTEGGIMPSKQLGRFNALAWVLGREPKELWKALLDEKERQQIPLHQRLAALTNPSPAGMVLGLDKDED